MNYFKLITLTLLCSFIASCFLPQGGNDYSGGEDRDDSYYDVRKERDEDRDDVLKRSFTRRSGDVCEKEDRDHECKEQCKEIYRRIRDRDDCEELTIAQVDKLFELWELLEKPDEDELEGVDPEDFDVFLNISIAALEDLVDDWSSRESKEFLYWLINNEDATEVFEKEDDDYDTLTAILREIKSGWNFDNIHEPFVTKIEGGRLMEVAIESRNEKVIEWFMEYIEDKNSDCQDETVSQDCFQVYCRIGDGIDDDSMEDWLDYDSFQSYIEDIVDDRINAVNNTDEPGTGSWFYGESGSDCTNANVGGRCFEDAGDTTDDWVKDLCGGLTS